jgi:hypothetical protein
LNKFATFAASFPWQGERIQERGKSRGREFKREVNLEGENLSEGVSSGQERGRVSKPWYFFKSFLINYFIH